MSRPVLIREAEVRGERVDVLLDAGLIVAIEADLAAPGNALVLHAGGGGLLPGLHDHHLHLLAIAAARRSIDISALDRAGCIDALRTAGLALPRDTWLRVIGYHESAIGPLDRHDLDTWVGSRPVRVQHATGAMWVCNSAALDAAHLADAPPEQVERDGDGEMTGRLYRLDGWFANVLPREPLDLVAVGNELLSLGITGVTDMTPYRDTSELDTIRAAVEAGELPQRVVISGAPALDRAGLEPLEIGPAKVIVDDAFPPDPDELARAVATAHDRGLPVALHCASRLGVVLALGALETAGGRKGDRIEHGAVIPPELFPRLRAIGATVVTQPAFVHSRGDRYLTDVEPVDQPHLWRCRSLIDNGIEVGFGSDAPHGPLDPWTAIEAAATRRTQCGRSLGEGERLPAAAALDRYLTPPRDPGGAPRRVAVGAPADLCLLHLPIADALAAPRADHVRATVISGVIQRV